jgi:hypothetical protein
MTFEKFIQQKKFEGRSVYTQDEMREAFEAGVDEGPDYKDTRGERCPVCGGFGKHKYLILRHTGSKYEYVQCEHSIHKTE